MRLPSHVMVRAMPISRSENMSRIRSRDSQIELDVRRILHRNGMRYRCCVKSLPGIPDIVFSRKRIAVFVHGCFWHQHAGCRRANVPKSNVQYWTPKLSANVERDKRNIQLLRAMGFCVVTLWGCEIERNAEAAASRIVALVNAPAANGSADAERTSRSQDSRPLGRITRKNR